MGDTSPADAIFTDLPALPDLLEKIGLRVPEDVALASAAVLDSGIDAGINPQSEEIGRVAVLLLSSLVHDAAPGLPTISRQMLVEGSWVDGPACRIETGDRLRFDESFSTPQIRPGCLI